MAAPSLDAPAAMAGMTVGSSLEATYADGAKKVFALGHEPFFVTGDQVPDGKGGTVLAGGYFDLGGRPIVDASVPGRERAILLGLPDGSSLLTLANPSVVGVRGNAVFAVVQFEYATRDQGLSGRYGQLPSPIAVLTLDQDPATGKLRLVKYHNVDMSSAHGLWITCGASLSPWNTHLSSEEFEPDAMAIAGDKRFEQFGKFLYGAAGKANPYHYGHLPEVTVHPDGSGTIRKHYCLGRLSHELVQVMPDRRTVLQGDDYTNGGLFLFVADREADLSAGTLYVAKWTQTSGAGPGAGTLSWIRLGHATSDEVKAMADTHKPQDIMEVRTSDPGDATFRKIPYSGKFNWVRVPPGMEKAAAFLETHRYAALMGGSLGFSKMEGTSVNAKDRWRTRRCLTFSCRCWTVRGHPGRRTEGRCGVCAQPEGHAGGPLGRPNRERLGSGGHGRARRADRRGPQDPGCAWQSRPRRPDRQSRQHQVLRKTAHAVHRRGQRHARQQFPVGLQRRHQKCCRVLSCPAGAEATGLHAVDEINGWTYVMSNFQHAGDWEKPLHDKVRGVLDPLVKANYKDRFWRCRRLSDGNAGPLEPR